MTDLRDHYAQTCLARLGMPYERAIEIPVIRLMLTRAAEAARKTQARQAESATINYQIQEAA